MLIESESTIAIKLRELSAESRETAVSLFGKNSALDAYLIVIQAGAIFAVTLLYRKQVWSVLLGFFGLDPRGRRLGTNLLLAFLPAAFIGPFLDELIEGYLLFPRPIACALFAGAILMYLVERKRKEENSFGTSDAGKSLDDLTARSSLLIGFLQCLAMWPGTSRSMMTIVGGYFVGLTRAKAAEFSFLLGLITLTAAAAYKSLTKWEVMHANLKLAPSFSVVWLQGLPLRHQSFELVGYLARRGLGIFVWYRIVLAAIILGFYFGGVDLFLGLTPDSFAVLIGFKLFAMGQPKRKHSKQRSRKRRGANRFQAPLLVKEVDGSMSRPHRVNPETGQYRGKQVLDLEV